MAELELVRSWYELMGRDPKLVTELQDQKRDLSLKCALMEKQFPEWKAESKQELLTNLVAALSPAVGAKKWAKAIASLSP